jgi:hypothetical protein
MTLMKLCAKVKQSRDEMPGFLFEWAKQYNCLRQVHFSFWPVVMLSEAKHLWACVETLRFAQGDHLTTNGKCTPYARAIDCRAGLGVQ